MTSTTSPSPTANSASTRGWPVPAALGLLSGGFVANGVPHTVFGLLGQDHTTPFGTDAATNLWWGVLNLALGAALSLPRTARRAYLPYSIAVGLGALSTAVSLLVLWS